MFCGWVSDNISFLLGGRVPSGTKGTIKQRLWFHVCLNLTSPCSRSYINVFLGNGIQLSGCEEQPFVLLSPWVIWGSLCDPFGQQLNLMQPRPTTESLAWLQQMAFGDCICPIIRNPDQNHLFSFLDVSTELGFHCSPNDFQFQVALPTLQPSILPIRNLLLTYPLVPRPPIKQSISSSEGDSCISSLDSSFLTNLSGSTDCT